jgi:signal transduction histidine kinase
MGEKKIVIDPRIIQHLGRDLITSPDVAIIELIKNSIDAKSKTVNIHLFERFDKVNECKNFITTLPKEVLKFVPEKLKKSSVLIVEDKGFGMSTAQLEDGFLKIGTDIKSNKTGDDIILGEKGIGRLAAQRLGDALIVETASESEDFISLTYLDWNKIVKGEEIVPYDQISGAPNSYTRLWIFNVNFEELLEYPVQLSLDFTDEITDINRDLQSALNFLVSPFNSTMPSVIINMYFNDKPLETRFPSEMLELSESTHYFFFNNSNNDISLNYGLKLQPWYIERIHRALVKADAFTRLKKPHDYYQELLNENNSRIDQALTFSINKEELCERIASFYEDVYPNLINKNNKETIEKYFYEEASKMVSRLCEIVPISGEIYSFKQNAAIGDKIIIESVKQRNKSDKIQNVDLKKLKQFLDNYNGIKLYRGSYRIGFLGNKESDWIKLQQYRTKGQQWFRFDLGNTVGYVSLNDPHQKKIKEISSRLDISQNYVSEAFKNLIYIVFNRLFYELNQKANGIVKVILEEKGLLGEPLTKRVKKNVDLVQQMIKKNKKMMSTIQEVSRTLEKKVVIDGASASMPKTTYEFVTKVIDDIDEHFKEDLDTHSEAANLLAEADQQLKIIEVESYNNYKLMANGLITETITHELHSLSTTNIDNQVDGHFESLRDYFSVNKEAKVYNSHVYPIKNSYNVISNKILQIGDMYSFLEKTFIKKGTYDEFIEQNIKELAGQVYDNLMKASKSSKIDLVCETNDLSWFVPKGVLVHVFYNLFSNSRYWIDIRRKRAEKDSAYAYSGDDQIIVEPLGIDGLVVSDTGTGVAPNMQDILFEPLQSGKPYNEGRGMGLYIVKKLMNSFNGDIILLPDLNEFGNSYKFLLTTDKAEEL